MIRFHLLCSPLLMLTSRRHQRVTVDSTVERRERLEFFQPRLEEPDGSGKRSPLHVVIRRRDLDESLEKLMNVRFRLEPQLFPRLMRFPELQAVESIDSTEQPVLEIRSGHGLERRTRNPELSTCSLRLLQLFDDCGGEHRGAGGSAEIARQRLAALQDGKQGSENFVCHLMLTEVVKHQQC